MQAERRHLITAPDMSWRYHVRRAAGAFGWHFHPEIELTLITKGSGTRIVGDSIGNYGPGDLTLIGAEVPHTYVSSTGTAEHEAIVVQLRRDFLGKEFLTRPEFTPIGDLFDAAVQGLRFVPEPLHAAALRSLSIGPPPERTLTLVRLLRVLADHPSADPLATAPAGHRETAYARRRVDAVCAFLQSAYTGPVRLSDVAAIAHMTPPSCSRFFRRALGRTITDYLTELRVAAACQLLTDTELPITEVATRSGFGNLSNFNRRFRMLKGTNPREYRRATRGST